jgi:hypothetical protein
VSPDLVCELQCAEVFEPELTSGMQVTGDNAKVDLGSVLRNATLVVTTVSGPRGQRFLLNLARKMGCNHSAEYRESEDTESSVFGHDRRGEL